VSACHERRMWDLHQGKHSDIFRYTTKELCSVAAQYTTSSEAAKFLLPLRSRKTTPSSSKEVPSCVTVQSTRDGTEGGKRRHKQRPRGATTTVDYDNGNNRKAGDSSMGHIMTTIHSIKHQVRLPTEHFKRLLEVACPNNVHPIRHKLKDYNMMKSLMISRSPTQGTELNEDLGGSDTLPFPGKMQCHTQF
jgi:hypothetical protein